MKKYGKSYTDLEPLKRSFTDDNDRLLGKALEINRFYREQPTRENCINCDEEIDWRKMDSMVHHGVDFKFCHKCGHLNGRHKDTKEFSDFVYVEDNGAAYAENYIDENTEKRVNSIYTPKAEFLLNESGIEIDSVLDVGCGAGYFLKALEPFGVKRRGVDLSSSLVKEANRVNEQELCSLVGSEEEIRKKVVEAKEKCIALVGVLEHMREPRLLIEAFRMSVANYMFISVPMVSMSLLIEMSNQAIFPRHLSSGHTHLYSNASLEWLEKEYGLRRISQWRFGVDIPDLLRSMCVSRHEDAWPALIKKVLGADSGELIDSLQLVLDRFEISSEIHLVWEKV